MTLKKQMTLKLLARTLVLSVLLVLCPSCKQKPATVVTPGETPAVVQPDQGEHTIRYIKLGGIALEATVDEAILFEQGMAENEVDPKFKKDLHDLLANAKTGLSGFNKRAEGYTKFDATAKKDVAKLANDVVGFLGQLNDAGLLKIKNPEKQKRAREILTGARLVARGFQVFSEATAVP